MRDFIRYLRRPPRDHSTFSSRQWNKRRCLLTSRIPYLFIHQIPRGWERVGDVATWRGQTATPTQRWRRRRRRRRDWGLAPRLRRPRRRSDRAPVSLLAVRATAAQTLQPLAGVLLLAPHATPSPWPAAPHTRHPRSNSRIHESAEHNRGGGRAQMPAVLVYETRLDAADWWLPRPVASTSVAEKPEEVCAATATRQKTQEKSARPASGRRARSRARDPRGSTRIHDEGSRDNILREDLLILSRDCVSARANRSPRCVLIYIRHGASRVSCRCWEISARYTRSALEFGVSN